jgi:hypothetical protein
MADCSCFSAASPESTQVLAFCIFAVCSAIHKQVQQQLLQPDADLHSQEDAAMGRPSSHSERVRSRFRSMAVMAEECIMTPAGL